jgi:hypothetical protein
MTLLDYNKVLRDMQYKPNVEFGAFFQEGDWHIRIVMMVENSRAPFKMWNLEQVQGRESDFFVDHYNRSTNAYRYVPDVPKYYSPSREVIEVVGTYAIPHFVDGEEDMFVEWMVMTIKSLENHEIDEWICYKGELINDPHKFDKKE